MGCEGCRWLIREPSGRAERVLLICTNATLRAGETRRVLGLYPSWSCEMREPRPVWCTAVVPKDNETVGGLLEGVV